MAIVPDRVIGRVHEEFMNIPGATDVITFEHGEIVMSARRRASTPRNMAIPWKQELALYTVHGLLHLNGFEDANPRDAARMTQSPGSHLESVPRATPQLPPNRELHFSSDLCLAGSPCISCRTPSFAAEDAPPPDIATMLKTLETLEKSISSRKTPCASVRFRRHSQPLQIHSAPRNSGSRLKKFPRM